LELDPNSTKSLFYSAIAALERQEYPLARERFERMLASNPPQEVRRIIEQQIEALTAMGVGGAPTADASVAAGPNQGASGQAAAGAGVGVALNITLDAQVADKITAGAPLFVMARVSGQAGAPLAARRLEARFPQDIDLMNSDAVMGGGFTPGQELEIEARVANGGSAMSRSGDPFGTVKVRVGEEKGRIALHINQLKP
ncbi:MAG: hypothetical protein LBE59_09430, partial [Nevskiaceae bacterium]|jgi:hypothetical protein|nr:hypothetical protein [Nevskiaceae bacterium]